MAWVDDIDLADYIVATAPYGGPIGKRFREIWPYFLALLRDQDQILDITAASTRPEVMIFSSAGIRISSFPVLLYFSIFCL